MNTPCRLIFRFGAILAAVAVVAGCGSGSAPAPTDSAQTAIQAQVLSQDRSPPLNFDIKTLSNRADLISDGNALIKVQVPRNVPMKKDAGAQRREGRRGFCR